MSPLELLGSGLLAIGAFCVLTGAIGLLRLNGFYQRTHAVSVTDSAGAGLILLGLLPFCDSWETAVRLLLIMLFALFASPTSTHALAQAALKDGLKPITHMAGRGKRK